MGTGVEDKDLVAVVLWAARMVSKGGLKRRRLARLQALQTELRHLQAAVEQERAAARDPLTIATCRPNDDSSCRDGCTISAMETYTRRSMD